MKKLIIVLLLIPTLTHASDLSKFLNKAKDNANSVVETAEQLTKRLEQEARNILKQAEEAGRKFLENLSSEAKVALKKITGEAAKVYAANAQTVGQIGRIQACIATTCMSEYVRSKNLKEVEADSYENFAQEAAAFDQAQKEKLRSTIKFQISKHESTLREFHFKFIGFSVSIAEKKELLAAIETNFALRKEAAEYGLPFGKITFDMYDGKSVPYTSYELEKVLMNPDSTPEQINKAFSEQMLRAWENDQEIAENALTDILFQIHDASLTRLQANVLATLMIEIRMESDLKLEKLRLETSLAQWKKRLEHVSQ